MSEFTAAMGASGNEHAVCGHATARFLAGEAEAARARPAYALEGLGNTVVRQSGTSPIGSS